MSIDKGGSCYCDADVSRQANFQPDTLSLTNDNPYPNGLIRPHGVFFEQPRQPDLDAGQ